MFITSGGVLLKQTFAGVFAVAILVLGAVSAVAQMDQKLPAVSLTQSQASHFAGLALKCISREYPNKPEHVMNDGRDVDNPKKLHPAFYGCYD